MGSKSFNLLWFIDEYILGLKNVHKRFLDMLSEKIKYSQEAIQKTLVKYWDNKSIPYEIGVFGKEYEFLLQYSYVEKASKSYPKLVECYNEKKYFKTTDCIKGNFEKIVIKYSM
ncbi:MAG: hypothetical protein K0S61_4843 [Anaerocolumna sp.]|jgi:hypothetical protein|nr:hypothetical protein [Anaerocolumna sp.]